MKHAAPGETKFMPKRSKQEAKADVTTQVAREIIDTEAARREAKTAKLRQARLESQTEAPVEKAPAKPRRPRPAPKRRDRYPS